MGRLILVPQYPTSLRYQEWWWDEFPKHFKDYFDEVIVLGDGVVVPTEDVIGSNFAPIKSAIDFEVRQIDEYTRLNLWPNDVLLLNDLSFPGLFAQVLYHKRPKKCFAICHATSKNSYDYYAKDRRSKYPVEKGVAKLFDKIFVGSLYHKHKLRWDNTVVTYLPFAPFKGKVRLKEYNVISVARPGKQKRNAKVERQLEKDLFIRVQHPEPKTWDAYYDYLSKSRILLITSNEETFGYQVLDAIANGCIPIAPNKFSYPELLPNNYLYNNYIELYDLIDEILGRETILPRLLITDMFFAKVSHLMLYG